MRSCAEASILGRGPSRRVVVVLPRVYSLVQRVAEEPGVCTENTSHNTVPSCGSPAAAKCELRSARWNQ